MVYSWYEFANDSTTAPFLSKSLVDKQLWQLAPLELPAWRPYGLVSLRQVLAHSPVTHLLAKGTVWQLWQWPDNRNPEALKAGFLTTVWGLWTFFFFFFKQSSCPVFSATLSVLDCKPTVCMQQERKKDRFISEVLFWLDISTHGMVWGVYLTAGISCLCIMVAYSDVALLVCSVLAVNHLS